MAEAMRLSHTQLWHSSVKSLTLKVQLKEDQYQFFYKQVSEVAHFQVVKIWSNRHIRSSRAKYGKYSKHQFSFQSNLCIGPGEKKNTLDVKPTVVSCICMNQTTENETTTSGNALDLWDQAVVLISPAREAAAGEMPGMVLFFRMKHHLQQYLAAKAKMTKCNSLTLLVRGRRKVKH